MTYGVVDPQDTYAPLSIRTCASRPTSVPSSRAAVRSVKTHGSRVGLATNSSSRSNTIFTGRLTCRARRAAMMSMG
jgi:hypothetical protein